MALTDLQALKDELSSLQAEVDSIREMMDETGNYRNDEYLYELEMEIKAIKREIFARTQS